MIALLVTIVVLLVLIFAAVTGTLGDLFFLTGALVRGAFLLACVAGTVALLLASA